MLIEKINPTIATAIVVSGSLVKTDKDYLFMSVALGNAFGGYRRNNGDGIVAPIAVRKTANGVKNKDTVVINDTSYYIEAIK